MAPRLDTECEPEFRSPRHDRWPRSRLPQILRRKRTRCDPPGSRAACPRHTFRRPGKPHRGHGSSTPGTHRPRLTRSETVATPSSPGLSTRVRTPFSFRSPTPVKKFRVVRKARRQRLKGLEDLLDLNRFGVLVGHRQKRYVRLAK